MFSNLGGALKAFIIYKNIQNLKAIQIKYELQMFPWVLIRVTLYCRAVYIRLLDTYIRPSLQLTQTYTHTFINTYSNRHDFSRRFANTGKLTTFTLCVTLDTPKYPDSHSH